MLSDQEICTAAIATFGSVNLSSVSVVPEGGRAYRCSYLRSDGKQTVYSCDVHDDEVKVLDEAVQVKFKNTVIGYSISGENISVSITAHGKLEEQKVFNKRDFQ